MVGERLDDAIERLRVVALERRSNLAMQRNPLASEELGVDGLSRQGVAKREPLGGFLHDALRCDQLLHERVQPSS